MTKNYFKNITHFLKNDTKTVKTALYACFFVFLFANSSFGQSITDTYTTTGAGTWTAPCGVTSVTVVAWGAGGSGGGSATNGGILGGAGGAGGTYVTSTLTVVPGTTYNLFVAPTTTGTNGAGSKGQGSWFNTSAILFAEGGNGGAAPTGGTVTGALGSTTSSIGTAIAGTNGADGTATIGGAGGNGGNGGGTGGAQRTTENDGNNGTTPGGGGGGAFLPDNTDHLGGNGARGEIRITYMNVIPANPGNPTSNSPQCNPPGVTLTRLGSPPAGVTWYWQTIAGGTSTANSGTTFTATTSGTYYIRAQHDSSGCWSPGSGSLAVTIINTPSITTNPANSVIAPGANTTFTTVASDAPTSYTWEVSTDGGTIWSTVVNGGVYSTATTATLNITAAPISMNGYKYRVTATNTCGTSAVSAVATLTVTLTYCAPTYTNGPGTIDGITNVTLGTLNNTSGANNVSPYYTFYSAATVPTLLRPSTTTISISYGTDGNQWGAVWIDFNQNGTFEAAEGFVSTVNAGSSGTSVITITVPAGALLGNTRMRVRGGNDTILTTAQACGASSSIYGETEDYIVNIIDSPACATPTAQPTTLNLTPTGTTLGGSFTAASPVADNYLVLISTSATAPSPGPVNGVSYIAGNTISGATVVDVDNNTSFTATGLTPLTTYYVYVYSFSTMCTGGPLYLNTVPLPPLTGSTTTLVANYCTPTTTNGGSSLYISQVNIIGTLSDPGANNSTFNTLAPIGYQDFSTLPRARQAQGEGVNIVSTCAGTIRARGTWKAWVDWNKDGDFVDGGEEIYNIQGWVGQTQTYGFVIPVAQAPGDYRIRIRVNNGNTAGAENYGFDFNPCENFGSPNGSTDYYGEAEDYLFTVIANCASKITSITDGITCGNGTATLLATGTGATQYRWYDSEYGGTLLASTPSGSWTTPSLSSTTSYWVTSFNGTCESVARTEVKAIVKPITTLTVSNLTPTVCGEGSIIDLAATGGNEVYHLIDETFEAGGLGVFSNVNNDASTDGGKAARAWANQTSTFVPNSTNGNTWFPAIASGFGTNKFALAKSDSNPIPNATIENSLTSNSIDGTGVTNLKLKLKLYYSRYWADGTHPLTTDPQPEYVTIEATTNNWATTTVLTTLIDDTGIGSRFATLPVYSLPAAFNNQATIRVRIKHVSYALASGGYLGDGVAVDDIELYGDKPLTNPSFVLSGTPTPVAFTTAACTPGTEYTPGTPVATIWVKPTLPQLELPSYSFTATATLSNGCPINTTINVTNQSKVWKGTTDNDWNKGSNWLPAVIPTATDCVIIPTGTTAKIMNTPNALAKNLSVKAPTGNLELQAGRNLTVTDWINVEAGAIFDVRNSANLVQVNNAPVPANSGNINMERIANLRLLDYSYWSSPVGNLTAGTFPVTSVSPGTSSGYIFQWNTTAVNSYGGQGNWVNTTENMIPGKGYIVRGPSTFNNTTTTPLTASFTGVPSNGIFTPTIYRGTDLLGTSPTKTITDDNWNLLGNPYPSAIGVKEFLTANAANLTGGVRLWTHGQLPTNAVDPFYQNFVVNYYASDYVTANPVGATSGPGDPMIGAGQGFMVLMNNGAAGSSTVTFNNSMRNATFNNSVFYRTANSNAGADEKHRLWLDLVGPTGNVSRTLLGYVAGATQGNDNLYDAFTDYKNPQNFYSLINNEIMTIQGRALPFDTSDIVTMGMKIPSNGTYNIAIATVDGLFANNGQTVYLEDKVLNTVHNLTNAPYQFTANQGIVNDRFVIRYKERTLSTNENSFANGVNIFANTQININSSNAKIKNVMVYDILGKTLVSLDDVNQTEVALSQLKPTSNVLVVKVILENEEVIIKKIIF